MALSQLGQAALNKAIATSLEMTKIAVTPDEKKLAAGVAAIVAKIKAVADGQGAAAGFPEAAIPGNQMESNRQYLELQRQMERENRSYLAVSNIMKTKHDTVKNSISNIR